MSDFHNINKFLALLPEMLGDDARRQKPMPWSETLPGTQNTQVGRVSC